MEQIKERGQKFKSPYNELKQINYTITVMSLDSGHQIHWTRIDILDGFKTSKQNPYA